MELDRVFDRDSLRMSLGGELLMNAYECPGRELNEESEELEIESLCFRTAGVRKEQRAKISVERDRRKQ